MASKKRAAKHRGRVRAPRGLERKAFQLRIPVELKEELEDAAAQRGLSMSALIEEILCEQIGVAYE
jgi:predicted HicB family RNase H-like nuclease